MKKFKFLCLFILMFLSIYTLTSCDKIKTKNVASAEDLHNATKDCKVEVIQQPWGTEYKYKGDKSNINITSDFTIDVSDDFFSYNLDYNLKDRHPGRIMEKMTLEGNGHTITITGNINGSLGRYNKGLFARLDYCTVSNLNIVYDVDLNINGSSGSYFGGLSGDACGSNIENVTVTYKKGTAISFMTDKNGYHNSHFGGLIGKTAQSTITNCTVNGNLYGTGGHFGGLLGYQYSDTSISNCVFNGSVKTVYLEESFVGGLVGYSAGEISSCAVYTNKLHFVGQPQAWRTRTSSIGGFVGKLDGNLHDCYLEFEKDGYMLVESIKDGTFVTYMNAGVLVGEVTSNGKVKNCYADATVDADDNFRTTDNAVSINVGIGKNNSSQVSNIYYIDDEYSYNYEETFKADKQKTENGTKFEGTLHGEKATVEVCYIINQETGDVDFDKVVLTIGENVYNLTEENLLEGDMQVWDRIDNHQYIVTLTKDTEVSYTIKFERKIYEIEVPENVMVFEYKDIILDNSGSNWEFDSATGKPTLKK